MNSNKRYAWPCLTIFFAVASTARAATWYVATNGNDANPGTQTQPFQTIQRGINASSHGDTVLVGNGTYSGAADIDDLGMWNRILAADEISGIYGAGLNHRPLTLALPGASPVITTQPANISARSGFAATFSVDARGIGPFQYQWRFNGTNISGATGSGLTLSSFQSANQGNYSVVCFNSYGTVTSLTAQVLLNNPRFINTLKSGSSLQTTFVGISYTNYIIEASSNLTTWFPIKTNSSAIGVFNFTDTLPPAQPRRFYRGRQR